MSEPSPEDDEDLQTLFSRQRAADHKGAPAFHAMRTRGLESPGAVGSALPSPWRWVWPAAAALGLAITVLFTPHHRPDAPAMSREVALREIAEIDAALRTALAAQHENLTAWRSPTDFLLQSTRYETP